MVSLKNSLFFSSLGKSPYWSDSKIVLKEKILFILIYCREEKLEFWDFCRFLAFYSRRTLRILMDAVFLTSCCSPSGGAWGLPPVWQKGSTPGQTYSRQSWWKGTESKYKVTVTPNPSISLKLLQIWSVDNSYPSISLKLLLKRLQPIHQSVLNGYKYEVSIIPVHQSVLNYC